MFFVAVMAAGLWGLGAAFGAPQRSRWIMILALLVVVIVVHLVLPVGYPLRLGLGETAVPWLFVLGIAGLVWGYRWMLRRLRTQAVVKEEAAAIDALPPYRAAAVSGAFHCVPWWCAGCFGGWRGGAWVACFTVFGGGGCGHRGCD